jgi:alkylhydroperoxidase family enzyme
MGWSDEQLANMCDAGPQFGFTEAECAAIRFCDLMTLDPHGVRDDIFADLRKHFDEGQIVELASVIGLYNYFNRFNEALRMDSE